ncbi:MAG: M64 family metallopeptidase, partial [Polyangiaceae bacterium]
AESKRIAAELASARRADRGKAYFDYAVSLMDRGSFVEGREILAAIATQLNDTDIGKQALARWQDPLLRRRVIKTTGRDENRVNICFLAEGYPLERNEDQQAFDNTADRAQRLLEKQEPWSEYAGYFNYYAINLRSNDRGISREPGGIKKDTPCGGKIDGGEFTVDNAQARSWVERFPGPSQAVCIGNDSASVATGGGGAVAVVKGMIEVCGHELGHAFGGLRDEYDFSAEGKPRPPVVTAVPTRVIGPNVVEGSDRADVRAKAPWAQWLALGTANWTGKIVDVFEGADERPKNVWRPQVDCKMRTASSPFCCVCLEQMILRIYASVRPIDEVSPKDEKSEI